MKRLLRAGILLISLTSVAVAQTPQQTQPAPPPDSPEALKLQIERQQRRLQDWAQLSRYRDLNAKVTAPEKNELRVVFIFDVWHPDLTAAERDAVAALIGSEGGAGVL